MPLSIIKSHTLCKISSFSQTINHCSLFSSANFEKFTHVLSIQSSRDFLLVLKTSHFNKKKLHTKMWNETRSLLGKANSIGSILCNDTRKQNFSPLK